MLQVNEKCQQQASSKEMIISEINSIWIFNGANSRFPGGAFSTRSIAEEWILRHKLTGVLTSYPLNMGVCDWAIQNNFFVPGNESEKSSAFIQRFSSASQEHYHYENGVEE